MKSKIIIIGVLLLCLLTGAFMGIINEYYSLTYLFNIIMNRKLQINPEVEINPERDYVINIWYYPFFRTIDGEKQMKQLTGKIKGDINNKYPNIKLKLRELSYVNGRKSLIEAAQNGDAPDIYFNICNDNWLNEKYQIPVEWYISKEEKQGYYTVDWNNIRWKNHLWGFPLFVEEQLWYSNQYTEKNICNEKELLRSLMNMKDRKLFLNIYDDTSLRQLLSFFGLNDFQIDNNRINEESKTCFSKMYIYLNKLREKGIIESSVKKSMLKRLIEDKKIIAGPVNPWLRIFINKKGIVKTDLILENRIKIYNLNVFRQKDYKGDDHTKAVMEVAKYISKHYADEFAASLELKPGYKISDFSKAENKEFVTLLQLTPSEQRYWQEIIIPAWIDFWEKDLTVEQVMEKLR